VEAALLTAFSLDAREFGQGLHVSQVIAAIQNVPGIASANVESFRKRSEVAGTVTLIDADQGYLPAHRPANGVTAAAAEPAELLILDELSLSELEVKSA
jgi:hypothetical protein